MKQTQKISNQIKMFVNEIDRKFQNKFITQANHISATNNVCMHVCLSNE